MFTLFKISHFMLSAVNKILSLLQSYNQCFKILQFVGVYWIFYPLIDNVALPSLQLGMTGADQKTEAIGAEAPLHQRNTQRWEKQACQIQATVLLPMISVCTMPGFSRAGFSIGRTGTELFLPWLSDEKDGWSQVLKMMIHLVVISCLNAIASMVT